MTDEAIEAFLDFLEDVYERSDVPFSVCWDVRGGAFPSKKQFRRVVAWLDADGNGETWDERVQGNAAIIQNPFLRGAARLITSIAQPPQPSIVCREPHRALEFARDRCAEARSWSKR